MKLQLIDFDNLSKTLTLCIYIMCYTNNEEAKIKFIKYINEKYNSKNILDILENISNIINANILQVTEYNYEPYGASVNILTSDSQFNNKDICAHLDKSHISVHTYPDINYNTNVSSLRIDLEISTCGRISPLNALEKIVDYFNPDILIGDFKIRGFTRDTRGKRIYSSQDYKKVVNKFKKGQLGKYHILKSGKNYYNEIQIKMMKRKEFFRDCLERKTLNNINMFEQLYKEAKKIYLRR